MAVSVEEIAEIDKMLLSGPSIGFAELKSKFPHLSWTRCDATDVDESPFRSYAQYDLHLLDASEHCVGVTDDPVQATGFLLAKRS
jgi:hypothetical protein